MATDQRPEFLTSHSSLVWPPSLPRNDQEVADLVLYRALDKSSLIALSGGGCPLPSTGSRCELSQQTDVSRRRKELIEWPSSSDSD